MKNGIKQSRRRLLEKICTIHYSLLIFHLKLIENIKNIIINIIIKTKIYIELLIKNVIQM